MSMRTSMESINISHTKEDSILKARDMNINNMLTRASTTSIKSKPPTTRRSQRDTSVGSKIRYHYNKENLCKNKVYPTKRNTSGYIKFDQNTTRNRDTSFSHKEFKPQTIKKTERRNSYAGRRYISDR
mmetsp:Transcript_5376/g.4563  ORF Transcript_5376/g.4563 Transcript_5376/m.4563 type:complete len:128 (+) Transcript_5376:374-757(+)